MSVLRLAYLLCISSLAMSIASNGNAQQKTTESDVRTEVSPFSGSWTGALDVGAIRLRLVFNLIVSDETILATLDSPDQGAKGIPLDSVAVDGRTIRIASTKMKAVFAGSLNDANNKIEGTWSQGGREFLLVLDRAAGPSERLRPQTPHPPFPYQVEEVLYPHQTGKFHLAATLTIPHNKGLSPAVILVSGSGAQDRDETIFEHRPFAVWADHLTKCGMIVLRVDDRGVGGTGTDGSPDDDTTSDFATDVRSGLAYLRSRNEVDPKRIGIIGHSEGALIGTMVAAEDPGIAFLVLLAGPGVPGHQLLALQSEKIARASGASDEAIANLGALQAKIFSIIRDQPDVEAGKREARNILLSEYTKLTDDERKLAGSAEAFVEQHSTVVGIPWFRYFLTFDPQTVFAQVKCPVLALTGEKDLQVPPEQNLPAIEEGLLQGRSHDVTVKELPSLNHLLQTATSGLVTEYGEIEETIAPVALKEVSDWLTSRKLAP
ncbi:MAG: alpha/beta hydrolase [Planctomycetaceae bacterium]|nr:alpha/beta hydrolase [Planctomycetaceae bacterium]